MSDLGPVTDPANDPVFEKVGLCHTCVHRTHLYSCAAFPFPSRIPMEILTGNVLHIDPYPGDNGIQFKRMIRGV